MKELECINKKIIYWFYAFKNFEDGNIYAETQEFASWLITQSVFFAFLGNVKKIGEGSLNIATFGE